MKKGFTLMELLVIIGLLGMLLTITIVSYSSIVKDSKKAAYDRQVSTIIQVGKDYVLNTPSYTNLQFYLQNKYLHLKTQPSFQIDSIRLAYF